MHEGAEAEAGQIEMAQGGAEAEAGRIEMARGGGGRGRPSGADRVGRRSGRAEMRRTEARGGALHGSGWALVDPGAA